MQLIVASTPTVIATGSANATGSVTITGNLPAGLADGAHTLALFAPVSGIGYRSAFSVTTAAVPATVAPATVAPNTLPATGSDSDQMPFALGIIALGLALIGFKRRRAA